MRGLPRLPLTLPPPMAGVSEDLRSAWQRCERRQKEENARDVSTHADVLRRNSGYGWGARLALRVVS